MARWRRAIELGMTDEQVASLTALSRSRTELASRVERAKMLLAYRESPSFWAVGQRLGVHHQTVQRCVERALGRQSSRTIAGAGGPLSSSTSCSDRRRCQRPAAQASP
jgi:hypothetical protein